jgi:hypothetical protein
MIHVPNFYRVGQIERDLSELISSHTSRTLHAAPCAALRRDS